MFFDASRSQAEPHKHNKGKGKNNKSHQQAASSSSSSTKDARLTVQGLVLAGCGPLKQQVYESPFLNPVVKQAVVAVVDVQYGGDFGFHKALELCATSLQQDEFEQETKAVKALMAHLSNHPQEVAIGKKETLTAIRAQAAKSVVLSWASGAQHLPSRHHGGSGRGVSASSSVQPFAVRLLDAEEKEVSVDFAKDEMDVDVVAKRLMHDHEAAKRPHKAKQSSSSSALGRGVDEDISAFLDDEEEEAPKPKKKREKKGKGKKEKGQEKGRSSGAVHVSVESTRKYFVRVCREAGVPLTLVGVHSPETCQFAKGLDGCAATLHMAMDLHGDDEYSDDDGWF